VKPALLLVSPVLPLPTGNGLAMRAHAALRVLAAEHRVSLLVASARPSDVAVGAVAPFCDELAFVPAGLWDTRGDGLRRALARVPGWYRRLVPAPPEWARARAARLAYPFRVREFACAHVFRLYTVPLLDTLAPHASWRAAQLDVDELESVTRRRLAALHAARGDAPSAARVAIEAEQYARLERERLPRFDRVLVCSSAERDRVREAGLHSAPEVAPNVVPVGSTGAAPPLRSRAAGDAFHFFFVGTLGFLPNADAVWQLAAHVLPLLRSRGLAVRLDVAGGGLPAALARDLASRPDVRLLGFVPDLSELYRDTDAVVVPLRAGGGTRIKVLEAFAHGRPVVATPAGIEGIDARDGVHALIADLVPDFAERCAQLAGDAGLARELCRNAHELVHAHHSDAVLRAALMPASRG
jgi:glycosyltransferase involved in cell wall biosynthesis